MQPRFFRCINVFFWIILFSILFLNFYFNTNIFVRPYHILHYQAQYLKYCEPLEYENFMRSEAKRMSHVRNYTNIPRIIHQSWKTEELLPRFQHFRNTFIRDYNEKYHMPLWTDENNLEFMNTLEGEVKKFLLSRFEGTPILIADFCRYLYMYHYGGIYFDLDSKSFKSLDIILNDPKNGLNATLFLAEMGIDRSFSDSIPNAFLASRKEHPFWKCLIGEIISNEYHYMGLMLQGVESRTGPRMLKYVYEKYPHFRIQVLNSTMIFPFNWNHREFIDYQYCNLNSVFFDETACDRNFERDSYSISYWSHTWQGELSSNLNQYNETK